MKNSNCLFSVFTVTPSKLKMQTIKNTKFKIWEIKEDKYTKSLAKNQVCAIFHRRDIWKKSFTHVLYGDAILVSLTLVPRFSLLPVEWVWSRVPQNLGDYKQKIRGRGRLVWDLSLRSVDRSVESTVMKLLFKWKGVNRILRGCVFIYGSVSFSSFVVV